jgi:uncharacterized repeat protein (TIGR02543 family)
MKRILFCLFVFGLLFGASGCMGSTEIAISFEENGGSEVEDMRVNTSNTSINFPEPTKEGFTFDGWYLDENLTQPFTIASLLTNTSLTLYAKWTQNTATYTLTFESNGGSAVAAITGEFGTVVTEPMSPTKTGFTFDGWYSDASLTTLYIFSTMPAENVTLYAKWTQNTVTYTLTFESNGGSAVAAITGEFGTVVTEPMSPTKTGFTFDGWYSDASLTTLYIFSTMPAENITLYAKWTQNTATYTLTFEPNGGSSVASITGEFGTVVTEPIDPTKTGFTFDGWYSDVSLTTLYNFSTMPAENITLYAKWTVNQYTITFNTNGGSAISSLVDDYLATITAPTAPTRLGYTFDGWYSDVSLTTLYNFSTMPAENITLYAKWTVNQYTITFNTNGGSAISSLVDDYLATITAPTAPTRLGYTFDGWYSDVSLTTLYNFSTMPAENITLYAKWTVNQYTITFNTNGGSAISSLVDDYLATITAPTAPTRLGYTFDGWYSDVSLTTLYNFSTMPAENITLYAKWTVNQYTIIFEENGGSSIADITQSFGSTLVAPADPIKEGHNLGGWYTDSGFTTRFYFSNMPAENITLYARWNINNYTITFEENGGSMVGDITQGFGSTVIAPVNPTRDGYTFDGWYANEDLSISYTFTTIPSQNITLYAAWAANPYTITFEENGGTEISALHVNYGEPIPILEHSQHIGHTFEGWYLDIALTQPFNLTHMPSHDIILYAKWISTVDVYKAIDLQYAKDFAQSIITFALETGQYMEQHPIKLSLLYYQVQINEAETVNQVIEHLNQMITDLSLLVLVEPTPVELINGIRSAMKSALGQAYTDFSIIAQDMGGYPIPPTYLDGIYTQLDQEVNPQTAVPIMTKITLDSIIFMMMTLDNLTIEYVLEHIEALYNMYKTTIDASELIILEAKYAETLLILDAIKLHENIINVYDMFLTYVQSLPGDFLTMYKAYVTDEINALILAYDTHPHSSEIITLGNTYVVLVGDAMTAEFIDGLMGQFLNDLEMLINDVVYIHFETTGGTLIESIYGVAGDPAVAPIPPTKDQYMFDGWYTDETYLTAYVFSTFPNTSITLYAKWRSAPTNQTFESAIDIMSEDIIHTSITFDSRVLYYKFTPMTSGLYHMFSQGGYDTYISLYDASYVLLQSNDDGGEGSNFSLLYHLTVGNTYYMKVNLYNEAYPGDFSWTIQFSYYQGNDEFDSAITIYEGETYDAATIYQEQRIFYQFIPETTGYYKIESLSINNLYIELYDDIYQMIGYQYTRYYYGNFSRIKLYSGEVYNIAIMFYDDTVTGNLDFGIHYQGDTNENITNATLISSALTTHELSLEAGKVKYIQLTIEEMGHYILSWQCDFSVFIELYDENFHRLTNSHFEKPSFSFYGDQNSIFYIVIIASTYGDYGSIELDIVNIDPQNTDIDHASLLTYNGVTDILFYDDDSHYLYYFFIVQETGWHQIYSSGSYDTYIELFDENFTYLAYDDDSGQDYNFNLKYYFEAGQKYYVVLDFYGGGSIKNFDVSMIYSTNQNIDISNAINMYNGETVYGSLMLFNERLYYQFVPDVSGYYHMMTSIDENMSIYIYDNEGKFIGYYYSQVYYYNLYLIHFDAGQTYYFRVKAYDYEIFDFDFQLYHDSNTNESLTNAQQIYAEEMTDVWVVTQDDSIIPYYKFIPEITGYYIIEDISEDMLAIEIYDINGHYLYRNNYQEYLYNIYLYQDQVYYINVLTWLLEEDQYSQIMIKYVDYENIDINHAKPIQSGDIVNVTILDEEDSLYYQFIPSESGDYNIFSMGYFYTSLIIYDANFEYLTQQDYTWSNNNFNLEYYFEMGITYYLSVQMESDVIGRFDINIYHGEALNTSIENAIPVVVDQDVSAVIVDNNVTLYYEFVPGYTGYYLVYLEGTDSVLFEIYDDAGHLVPNLSEHYSDDYVGRMFYFQKDRTYTITVGFYNDRFGILSFIINLYENMEADFSNATEVYSEVTINTTITEVEKVIFYKFTPTTSGYYYVSSQGDEDTYITLYDGSYTLLKQDDDSGSDYNFGLLYYFESGTTYYLKVNLYGEGYPGSFSWTIIPGNDLVNTLTFITNGGTEIDPISGLYDSYIENPVTIREGYTFDGWYLDNEYLEYFTDYIYSMPASDYTLYAKWRINSYYIDFCTNGGTWIDYIYDVYGATFENPITTMEGYTFIGWYEDYELTIFYGKEITSVPARDLYLYAMWEINTYTLTFDTMGGVAIDPITGVYQSEIDIDPIREGYTFDGWYLDSEYQEYFTHYIYSMPAGDYTLYAKWNINNYYIGFSTGGGTWIDSIYDVYGTTFENPITTQEGYTFVAWYEDYELTIFYGTEITSVPARDLYLYAKWEINTYTLTFDTMGGVAIDPITGVYQSSIDVEATKEGYTFDGWYLDSEYQEYFTHYIYSMPASDYTLYAKWNSNSYNILFYTNGGTWIDSIYDVYGTTFENPITTQEGYTFIGWYEDYDLTILYSTEITSVPARDLYLYAKWEINTYTLTFDTMGGVAIDPITGVYQSSIDVEATKEGYTFDGWYLDSEYQEYFTHYIYSMPAGNYTLYAKWSINNYYIGFSTGGGTWIDNIYDVYGATFENPVTTQEGYTFVGWYEDYELTIFYGTEVTSMPARNLYLYAKWEINTYTLTFDTMGGVAIDPITGVYQSEVNIEAIREGYTFDGWYLDSGYVEYYNHYIYSMPAGDYTLYAKWSINSYSIDFYTNGGTWLNYIYDTYGTTFENPVTTKEGYTFVGWYEDYELLIFYGIEVTSVPARNLYLYAMWEINTYTLTFDTMGGGVIDPITGVYQSEIDIEPIREGYTFDGWYLDSEYQEYFTHYIYSMPAGDYTLYAKWTINNYYIGFSTNGGTWIDSIYADYGTTFENPVTTQEGYTFMGWYEDYDLTIFYGTEITSMPARNLYLYAKWEVNQYEIGYEILTNDYDSLLSIPLHLNETFIAFVMTHVSIALTSEHRIFTWGYNGHGTLGDGTTTTRITPEEITDRFNLSSGEFIISIDLGSTHASALTSLGRVFMWGYNAYGQLGDGTSTNRSTPIDITSRFGLIEGETIIILSLGTMGSQAITSEGRVFTWGRNEFGQLGSGTTAHLNTPTDITSNFSLNEGESIIYLNLGDHHSSALTSENRVFMIGKNDYGQLGNGTTTNQLTPIDITSQFSLNEGELIINLQMGDRHSHALTSDGRFFSWGYNDYGQLGDGTTAHRYIPTDVTEYFDLVEDEMIQSMMISSSFTASVLTSEGRVFIWGFNGNGQLGDGTTTNRYVQTEITGNFDFIEGESISSMFLGGPTGSAISSKGRIFTWGQNISGQLGDGTTTNRLTPVLTRFYYPSVVHVDTFDYAAITTEYTPTKAGYTFTGWYTDRDLIEPYTFTYMPSNDFILYGSWIPIEYDITYILDDGTNNVNNPVTYTIEDVINLVEPSKDGYTFVGWFNNDEFLGDAITTIQQGSLGNITLYAKWS